MHKFPRSHAADQAALFVAGALVASGYFACLAQLFI